MLLTANLKIQPRMKTTKLIACAHYLLILLLIVSYITL